MTEIKLIIFDWDDVFTLGSKEGYFKCYQETLEEFAVVLDAEEQRKRIIAKWGQAPLEVIKELMKEKPELINEAYEVCEKKLFGDTFADCLSLVPGSIELLNRLNKNYILTVATGLNAMLMKEKVIPKFNIPDVFSQIISTWDIEDPGNQKPSAFIANNLMKNFGATPKETIIVGDAKNDVLMAQNAGVTPVVVLTGHLNKKEAEELGVEHIIDDVTQLEGVLKKLEG